MKELSRSWRSNLKILLSLASVLAGLTVSFSILGCAPKEQLTPLYDSKPYVLDEQFSLVIVSDMPMTIVRPSFLKRLAENLFGWIPVVGDLIKIPVDLAQALIPTLTDVSHPELPAGSKIDDPEILRRLSGITIAQGELHIVPPDQRGHKPEQCWFSDCKEEGFKFIDEIRIYMTFEAPKDKSLDPAPSIMIGSAKTKEDASADKQHLEFEMTNTNLKPYFENYQAYHIDLVANARLPKTTAYIAGSFAIRADFHLTDETESQP